MSVSQGEFPFTSELRDGEKPSVAAACRGLLYIKSSLTGDENDYIVDYKRRNPSFPHETTADQFFTEEQFEVYRALGFHAVNSAFKGADRVAMIDPTAKAAAKNVLAVWQGAATTLPLEKRLRDILRL